MDWTTLLLAVALVYIAYEVGRWSMRSDIQQQAEIQVTIMKALQKATQEAHYQSIVDRNERMEQEKEDYKMDSEKMWSEIEEAEQDIEWEELTDNKKDDNRTN